MSFLIVPYYRGVSLAALGARVVTNLLLKSEAFDNASWGDVPGQSAKNVTANTDTAPDSNNTADTLTDNDNTFMGATQSATVLASTTYCASLYVKKDATARATRFGLLRLNTTSKQYDCAFDTSTGEVSSALGSNTPVEVNAIDASTYWRFYVSGATAVAETTATVTIFAAVGASNFASYAGTAQGNIRIWGAQLETGTSPGTYTANL